MSVPKKKPMILASASPRRSQLLRDAGYPFEVIAPRLSEPATREGSLLPEQQALALAYYKARSVAEAFPGRHVLGADTIVALGGEILGKPADEREAREMLGAISGTRHRVITGVAWLAPDRRLLVAATTFVKMREITSEEIEGYLASGEWAGKAGAYAIQETADRFVEEVRGSFTNIVGLPMELVAKMACELQDAEEAEGAQDVT
jgi:nucleoside triphosphate pyrophosphatase